MAITESLPKEKTQIEGSKEVLEGIYAMMQKLASYEDKEEMAMPIEGGFTEWWGKNYNCNGCGGNNIWLWFKYCPDCGRALEKIECEGK